MFITLEIFCWYLVSYTYPHKLFALNFSLFYPHLHIFYFIVHIYIIFIPMPVDYFFYFVNISLITILSTHSTLSTYIILNKFHIKKFLPIYMYSFLMYFFFYIISILCFSTYLYIIYFIFYYYLFFFISSYLISNTRLC